MGIGSLRRYHAPATSAASKAAEVEPGPTDTDAAVKAAEAAEQARLAQEQQEQVEAANSHPNAPADQGEQFATATLPDGTELGDGSSIATLPVAPEGDQDTEQAPAESVHPVIVEAGAEVQPEDTKHGELERPNRGSSTDAWRAYAEADPSAVKGWTEGLSRDDLAAHYLGAK